MSLEGTIRDLGLHEVGQLLSLGRKSGTLAVSSLLRGSSAWIRFVEGAITDAGLDASLASDTATAAALAGERALVEEVVLDVLAWREGRFVFTAHVNGAASGSHVRIPTDTMLVESARRDDAWQQLADRVSHADVVPSFVDVEPKALPLLRLVPQEWEVLTRVDGQRSLRTLAQLLRRELLEVAAIVHGLIGTGLLTVRDGAAPRRLATSAEMVVFEPMDGFAGSTTTVTPSAFWHVASGTLEPSSPESPNHSEMLRSVGLSALLEQGDDAARRGDFESALTYWRHYLRHPDANGDADRVRESIGLAARLQTLLYPMEHE